MPRKTKKENLYKTGVDTLAKNMTLTPKPKSIDDNIKHLRSLLSVDTILEDIDQDQSLEFLDAIESDLALERENSKSEFEELESKAAELEEADADNLIKKLKDLEDLDSDQADDLVSLIKKHQPEAIYDFVRSEGYTYVKIRTLVEEEKLRRFLEIELFPHYNDQQGDNYLL